MILLLPCTAVKARNAVVAFAGRRVALAISQEINRALEIEANKSHIAAGEGVVALSNLPARPIGTGVAIVSLEQASATV